MAYIALEGPEGCGKSTQAAILADRLDALVTREPGATKLGTQLRSLLLGLDQAAIGARAETLLMAADRAQHMDDVVLPALNAGRHVVSDRSVYSSMAYQGAGRELGVDSVRDLNQWALAGCWPDIVVLLDIDIEQARGRLGRELDRMEQEPMEFHQRVVDAYRSMAACNPSWLVVSAEGEVDQVAEKIWSGISGRLGHSSHS